MDELFMLKYKTIQILSIFLNLQNWNRGMFKVRKIIDLSKEGMS